MSAGRKIRRARRPLSWLLFLLLPEVALGYILAGAMLVAGGLNWGFMVIMAGMAVLFSFDLFDR